MRNRKIGWMAALAVVAMGAGLGMSVWSHAQAQSSSSTVWYVVVNRGHSAGSMAAWQRLPPEGFHHTIPLMENFSVEAVHQPDGAGMVMHDGATVVGTNILCSSATISRSVLTGTRDGTDQPVIVAAIACGETAPPMIGR